MARRAVDRQPAGIPAVADASLVYVSDEAPGIRRQRRGSGFGYVGPDGKAVRDPAELARIRSLAIPPAYTAVWICLRPDGHLQATGRDARGRKQYRYHPRWRAARDESKFERMLAFGAALPRIRARVNRDLALPPGRRVERRAVLAALVRLLDTTLVRVGNDEYARQNGSFGLTTLRNRHAAVQGSVLRLRFRGKSGVQHAVAVEDPRVARIVRRCQAIPGQELFRYEDADGASHAIGSADVNDYLREAAGDAFSAKDFRTWHASVQALALLQARPADMRPTAQAANELLAEVARRLGNTVAVCRKSYVHPRLLQAMTEPAAAACAPAVVRAPRKNGLSAAERALMVFLQPPPGGKPRRRVVADLSRAS